MHNEVVVFMCVPLNCDGVRWCHGLRLAKIAVLSYAEIGDEFFCPEVIGDFPKEEAYHFFISQALFRANREVELSEGDWAKVWEVRGISGMPAVLQHSAVFPPVPI